MPRIALFALSMLFALKVATAETSGARVPVLVELFTSEGCSSCPPADQLLMTLQKTQPIPGAQIIPLGFHVDYWNGLGWKDEFSSAAFTQRQSDYVTAFKLNSNYTPQMVVDGQTEFVGSSESKAREAIAAAVKAPMVKMQIQRVASNDTSLALKITVQDSPPRGATADLYAALVQDNMETDVKRGENSGRKLHHTAVVRSLTRIATIEATNAHGLHSYNVSIPLPIGTKPDQVGSVAFLQDRQSRKILGATSEHGQI